MVDLKSNEVISSFNEAGYQIKRLADRFDTCNECSSKGDLPSWRWNLHVIWRELAYDIFKMDSKDDVDSIISSLKSNSVVKEFSVLDRKISFALMINKRPLAYKLLNDMEFFLRVLQNKANKGGAYSDGEDMRM